MFRKIILCAGILLVAMGQGLGQVVEKNGKKKEFSSHEEELTWKMCVIQKYTGHKDITFFIGSILHAMGKSFFCPTGEELKTGILEGGFLKINGFFFTSPNLWNFPGHRPYHPVSFSSAGFGIEREHQTIDKIFCNYEINVRNFNNILLFNLVLNFQESKLSPSQVSVDSKLVKINEKGYGQGLSNPNIEFSFRP